jgi:hypothetical protein
VGKANEARECAPDGVPTIQQRRSIQKMAGTAPSPPLPTLRFLKNKKEWIAMTNITRRTFAGALAVLPALRFTSASAQGSVTPGKWERPPLQRAG